MHIYLLHLASVLLLATDPSHAQRITPDLAMMQYFQARLIQLEVSALVHSSTPQNNAHDIHFLQHSQYNAKQSTDIKYISHVALLCYLLYCNTRHGGP